MKIAFISYEYPPDTGGGGIGTYVQQVARMLVSRGHVVEIFSASPEYASQKNVDGIIIHRVQIADGERSIFSQKIGKLFLERHREAEFDVLEGPDYGADAWGAVNLVSEIPFVVKLHTPTFLVSKINQIKPTFKNKINWYLSFLIKFQKLKPYPNLRYDSTKDIERQCALRADEVVGISKSVGKIVQEEWGLDPEKVSNIPNPYNPPQELLDLPVKTNTKRVTFLGRLEIRKGAHFLADAIPHVLKKENNIFFRFVGKSLPSPDRKLTMKDYILKKVPKKYRSNLEFIDFVPLEKIPRYLGETDICVFPSLWENFPYVCLEAMSAGRGVVVSKNGGMAEMLDGGRAGLLVDPTQAKDIAEKLLYFLKNPDIRMKYGEIARSRVLNEYSIEKVALPQEECYLRAIGRRKGSDSLRTR